ncbi:MAG TPA: formylglycine-generating enzyme family protein [Pseudomonadota bacterium]|jgi:formylglycine-generating enzyme required for sulfatase activity|nr:formylglycine-generating enzyme family protein [Pseudomonadota bacterium]HNN52498.1 formylglycine-generating enzyme family protein [Pseudomonadota bacterium]
MKVAAHVPGRSGSLWRLLAVTLLGGGLLTSLSCEHRAATAKPRPKKEKAAQLATLKLFENAPTDEPPPQGFLLSGEPEHAKEDKPNITKLATSEVPCPKDPPPGMVCIPGGPFFRGNDHGGKPDEKPRMRITVSPFFLDTTEVTNEQYFRCVEAGKCEPPIKYFGLYVRPKQPVVAVSWYQAYDFCHYANKRLPTEAEWEKAARGPDGEAYPWGNEQPNCKLAVYEEPLGAKGCGTGTTADVATHGAFRYGLYDMAGNSWEWVNDWKSDCYKGCKNECGTACDGPDPQGPCGGGPKYCKGYSEKLLKGGSWYFTGDRMRGAERRGVPPSNRGPHRLGFRCAKTIE